MKKILTHFRIWFLASKWVGKMNIGSRVIYNGKTYMISNGVSKPLWALFIAEPHEYIKHVHQNDFKLIQNFTEWKRSFRSGLNFYYGYWFHIWASEPLLSIPRMTIEKWLRSRNRKQ